MTRTCLMPAEHWEIRDTWRTLGLKGTGSHHVALTDGFVPDGNFFEFPFGASFAPDPHLRQVPGDRRAFAWRSRSGDRRGRHHGPR